MVLLIRLISLALAVALACGPAHAQASGTMSVQLEVLPRVLTVSVTSARMDFGQQRADAGRVVLDPSTGLISTKAAGTHALGEVQLRGPAHAAYAVSVAHLSPLKRAGSSHEVNFELKWARSEDCQIRSYRMLRSPQNADGILGPGGCAVLRLGGSIALWNAAEGHYAGQLSVRIYSL